MSAHTPWQTIERFDGDESTDFVITSGDEVIAYMPGIGQHDFDNAHLMAAAPELLEQLKLVLPILEGINSRCTSDTSMILSVRAAIAKATGGAA